MICDKRRSAQMSAMFVHYVSGFDLPCKGYNCLALARQFCIADHCQGKTVPSSPSTEDVTWRPGITITSEKDDFLFGEIHDRIGAKFAFQPVLLAECVAVQAGKCHAKLFGRSDKIIPDFSVTSYPQAVDGAVSSYLGLTGSMLCNHEVTFWIVCQEINISDDYDINIQAYNKVAIFQAQEVL